MKEYGWREESFWSLAPDCLTVLGAEIIVDWLKHAFITRDASDMTGFEYPVGSTHAFVISVSGSRPADRIQHYDLTGVRYPDDSDIWSDFRHF